MRKHFEGAPKTVESAVHGARSAHLQRALFAVTIFVVMCTLGFIAASCGKSSKGIVSRVGTADAAADHGGTGVSPVNNSPVDRVTMSIQGPLGGEFVFEPLDGDGSPDKKGENAYELKLEDGGGDGGSGTGGGGFGKPKKIELTITAKKDMGNSWKYALGYITYDPEKYNPVEFKPGDLFGDDEKEVLNATLFQQKGRIAFWCGLLNFDKKDAKPGGDIGTFVIELAPWEPPRGPSEAPDGGDSPPELCDKVDDVKGWSDEDDDDHHYIYFSEVNRGDGDISGEVGIPDITPIALNWDEYVETQPWLEVVDYWGDGHIYFPVPPPGLGDLAVISENYLKTVGGYRIEVYEDDEMEELLLDTTIPGPDSSEREDISSWDYGFQNGSGGFYHSWTGQVGYFIDDESFQNINPVYVLLTPYDAATPPDWGVESDLTMVEFKPNIDPVASIYTPYDVVKSPYIAFLDASGSYDDDGTITGYEWDLDDDQDFEVDTGTTTYTMFTMVNEGDYTVRVKVTDNGNAFDIAETTITARDHLNEAGFASNTVDVLAENVMYTDYSIPIVFRDTEQALAAIKEIRIEFSGDTDNLQKPSWSVYNVKVWDGNDTQWGYAMDGFMNPLYNGIQALRYGHFDSNIALLNVSYVWNALEVDPGTSDIALEFKFGVNTPHDALYLTMVYDSERGQSPAINYYEDLNQTASEFFQWSTFSYAIVGYTYAICPASE